jgi:hypothetical protein
LIRCLILIMTCLVATSSAIAGDDEVAIAVGDFPAR